ncbi:MAG: DUF1287 domain-containing protein [Clostridia bacterium]|nr:DUF1287 domain-containing protein [Clostridia bacterium]
MHQKQKFYTAEELNITETKSGNDEDKDGIDDYTDICLGAREYIETKPVYKSKYYEGGYPNDKYGVCTDVIWHALSAAGYDLKSLVDTDIANNKDAYGIETPDPNIDFRRVNNLKIFFDRNAESLNTSLDNPQDWQAGDIVVFTKHIAICSDKRNSNGIPFIIHHSNIVEGATEADEMGKYTIVGHYRWNKELNDAKSSLRAYQTLNCPAFQ